MMKTILFILICIISFSSNLLAKTNKQSKLKIIGVSIESVFGEDAGLEEQLLKNIFKCMDQPYELVIVPFGRHFSLFNNNDDFDAVATVPSSMELKGFRSQSHIKYYNGITTLKAKNHKIKNFEDLAGLKLISFVGAKEIFPKLKAIIPKLKSYKEMANQRSHSLSLYNERVDAIFSDGYIVSRYNSIIKMENKDEVYRKPVVFNLISEPTAFTVYFRESSKRDLFNKCLNKPSMQKTLDSISNEYRINQMINN